MLDSPPFASLFADSTIGAGWRFRPGPIPRLRLGLRPGRGYLSRRRRMEEIVDPLSELRGDLGHRGQLSDRRCPYSSRGAERLEELSAQRRADAGDLVEHRADRPALAELLVIADRESMRLVADLLEREQRARAQVQHEWLEPIRRVHLLGPPGQG